MGMVSDLNNQSRDLMDDPETRDTIQTIAYEHGMTVEEAKTHYLRQAD